MKIVRVHQIDFYKEPCFFILCILCVCVWIIWTTKECDRKCLRGELR